MPVPAFSSEQIKGRRVWILLEINFGTYGNFRLSTEPVSVPGIGGGKFDGGLDGLTFSDSIELFSTSESFRSVSVSAFLPVDVSALIARGFDPSRATAKLSQWVDGTNYEDRRRVMSDHQLNDPQYGESYEPFKFSLRSNLYDTDAMIPPIDATINEDTFFLSVEWQRGRSYPWIFGTPGKYVDPISGLYAYHYVSPAYQVRITGVPETSHWVVAGHVMSPGTTARIVDKAEPTAFLEGPVVTHRDGLGRLISVVANSWSSLTAGSTFSASASESKDFICAFTGGGGVANEQQTAPRRGMGEIVEYLLDYAPGLNVDRGRTRTAGALLNQIGMDGVISERVEVWRWLRANLLPFAPISMASGPDGMYPIVWNKDTREDDAVAAVDAVRDHWERTSPVTVEYLDGESKNQFSIAYAKNALDDRMWKTSTLSGKNEKSNAYSRASFKRYGTKEKAEEEAICFYRRADVDAVMSWWARIYAFPIRSVEYTASIEWGWLEAGSTISFSDSRLNITEQIAIVQAVEWSDQQIVGLRVVWLEDLPRDNRLI